MTDEALDLPSNPANLTRQQATEALELLDGLPTGSRDLARRWRCQAAFP
ncbi:hypothetical protein [Rhodopila sp.]|nr:hypothetical protein [Rhodopila sp.]